MAHIYDQTHQRTIPQEDQIAYLRDHGIHYEFWPVDAVPEALRRQSGLSEAEQQQVLDAFKSHLSRLAEQFGYISHDLIVLNPESTPNLEELLTNFERVHCHTEDEVRFIVDGEGVFTLTRNGDTFSVTVTPGDLISVPAGTEHYFTLTDRRNVKAIRLFQTKEGWIAIYSDQPNAVHEAR
ncbi:cupin domain-containing protein [Sulfobacillus harzensis]|uniref:Acireductone dioxygenase n=1 Tax=Sulfobacillus harzensis TaxID=2729629 RepID=A0A7Y0L150_9FIRM|nr:cupin domain-containing protein [Sulfobacillus harzensis]NMP21357.1 cupin domain-containing protein [Sulfobacillus harzensis]